MNKNTVFFFMLITSLGFAPIGHSAEAPTTTTITNTGTKSTLSYTVYSRSAVELFWSRVVQLHETPVYQLSRDDVLVYSGNGLSFFDSSVVAGHQYTYVLTVQGRKGQLTVPVSVSFNTNDGTGSGSDTGGESGGEPETELPASPITSLYASVYSSSAAELFWDRLPSTKARYEVVRDGLVLTTTKGTSYFDNTLQAGYDYTYDISVIEETAEGEIRYQPSSVSIATGGNKPPVVEPPTNTTAPSAPTNVRLDAYSSTTAELFWDRAPISERVVSTTIYRDFEEFAITKGTSFMDDTREKGRAYRYDIYAVNANGSQSTATTLIEP